MKTVGDKNKDRQKLSYLLKGDVISQLLEALIYCIVFLILYTIATSLYIRLNGRLMPEKQYLMVPIEILPIIGLLSMYIHNWIVNPDKMWHCGILAVTKVKKYLHKTARLILHEAKRFYAIYQQTSQTSKTRLQREMTNKTVS